MEAEFLKRHVGEGEQARRRPVPFACHTALFVVALNLAGCREPTSSQNDPRPSPAASGENGGVPVNSQQARLAIQPGGADATTNGFKPGHGLGIALRDARDNGGSFDGHLDVSAADALKRPVVSGNRPYNLLFRREAVLPKGQEKSLELGTWAPLASGSDRLLWRLAGDRRDDRAWGGDARLQRMPSYCYHFVVLAKMPVHYDYLERQLNSIRLHDFDATSESREPVEFYQIVRIGPAGRPGLPSHALCWTSIAYLLWDDFDPAQLDAQQQEALLDWLHWGGRLILSGPETLDTLRGSFLDPYLPATTTGLRQLTAGDLKELGRFNRPSGSSPRPSGSWPGATFAKREGATYLDGTGGLIVQRPVGRGRVVTTAFPLTGTELVGWPGLDCLMNACLLGHPPRAFSTGDKGVDVTWLGHRRPLDAALTSGLRYFARDAAVGYDHYAADIASRHDRPGDRDLPGPGVAAWNDSSPVAVAARKILRESVGIKVPRRAFLVWALGGYLLVLVPLNWLLFRLIRRVHWAWGAAPLITLASALGVIFGAKLDIGNARAEYEVAVVELQAGYPRGHVARYMALGYSLAGRFAVHLTDRGGLTLPWAAEDTVGPGNDGRQLICHRGEGTEMSGLAIGSNSTEFFHTEHLADFGGALLWTEGSDRESRVANHTRYALRRVRIVRKSRSGTTEMAEIGDLEAGGSARVRLSPHAASTSSPRMEVAERDSRSENGGVAAIAATPRQPDRASAARKAEPAGTLRLDSLLDLAMQTDDFRPGEVRLVAQSEERLPGMTLEPPSTKTQHATMFVVELSPGEPPKPEPDINARPTEKNP